MTHKTIVVFESDWEFVTSERDRYRAEVEALKSALIKIEAMPYWHGVGMREVAADALRGEVDE